MKLFHINIAKDQTLSRDKRALYYRIMVGYLAFTGLLLVLTAYQAAKTGREVLHRKEKMTELQKRFQAEHPGEKSIREYIQVLEASLDKTVQQMKGVLSSTPPRTPAGECLFRFHQQLPSNMYIQEMKIDPEDKDRSVVITLVIPARQVQEENDPSMLVQRWKEDEHISDLVTDLTLSDRDDNIRIGNRLVTKITCVARLRDTYRGEK